MSARVRPVWAAAALLLALVTCAPLLVTDVPAVLDYPNHLARFYVLAHPHDPVLSKMYAANWRVLPNLGTDVLGQALLGITAPDVGGRLLLALSLLGPLAGVALYARAAFGRWTWWSLGAGVVAYNAVFFMGFMNFLLGVSVALSGAAAWRVLRRRGKPALAAALGTATGVIALFCHLLGYGLFALLLIAQEAEEFYRQRREGGVRQARSRLLLLALVLAPAAILYLVTHRPARRGDVIWWDWTHKFFQLLTPFMIYDPATTVITAAVVVAAAVLVWRGAERATGVVLALIALAAVYLVAPFDAGGGAFVDTRLPQMAALLLFAGLAPRPERRLGAAVTAALLLLIAGRIALVSIDWLGRAGDLADLRASLAYIQPGATVLPAVSEPADSWLRRNGRTLPNYARMDENLPALVLLERHAFWPLLFADPNQQPVVVLPPYDTIADTIGRATPWPDLYPDEPSPTTLAAYPYLAHWRTRFDYVLLLGPKPGPVAAPAGLSLVRASDVASLYRVSGG